MPDLFGHEPTRRPNGRSARDEPTELVLRVHLMRADSVFLADTMDSEDAKSVGRSLIDVPLNGTPIEHWRAGDVVRLLLPKWKAQREGWI